MRRALPLAAILFSGCGGMYFYPSRVANPMLEPAIHGAGLTWENAVLKSADGTELQGMFFPSTAPANGTIVHFHGNGENMTFHAFFAAWLAKERYNVFEFDYRGYGASDGKPSIAGAIDDGVAALHYVSSRKGVDPNRIVVFGQSLGGALAIAAVAKSELPGVKAVVVESTFESYRSIARDKLNELWLTWAFQWPLQYAFPNRWNPRDLVGKIAPRPLLVIHGTADRVVPFKHGEALYEAARDPKTFWEVPKGGHTQAFARQSRFSAELRPKLVEWLDAALGPKIP
jgi:fermentation-respiration switch protein FrsA (DUF1100 family)